MSTRVSLAHCPAYHVLEAKVLGVYWMHDVYADEFGYGLHYQAAEGFCGVTLLADERSDDDAPLHIGDTVRLRPVGHRRHTIVDNLTLLRDAEAERVDWVQIAMSPPVAPAQLRAPKPGDDEGVSAEKDAALAKKYPAVAAFIDGLASRGAPRIAPNEAELRKAFTNGGW